MDNSEKHVKKMNMLGQLAFGIIHDMGNSLQVLRASSTMIRRRSCDKDLNRHVDAIDAVIDNTAQMIERVLHFSNKADEAVAEIDLSALLGETLALSKYLAPPNITLEYQHPGHEMKVMGNATELSQALLNLVKNSTDAIKPIQKDGLIILALRECFPWIELTVKDNGCGIAADQMEKMFEPLYTTKDDGTGIGLANVWATVESHGGVISVNSEPGKGTEFTIMLPKKT